ncbi:hypothetical protein Tco_0833081 [Tanacetum coccineum]
MHLDAQCGHEVYSRKESCAPISKMSPSPTAVAGTGEAIGVGMVKDAGEISKEPDDHSGNLGVVVSSVVWARRLAAPYPKPKGSSAAVSSTGTARCYCSLDAASSLSEPGPSSSYFSLSVFDSCHLVTLAEIPGNNGKVEDDGEIMECGEAILVSDASMGSDSSSE